MGTGQWILIYVVFMVVLFLPQILAGRKRKKTQETMLDSLKIGDEIVTIGGIYGKIAAVSETTVDFKKCSFKSCEIIRFYYFESSLIVYFQINLKP